MKLVVLSPESDHPLEASLVQAMIERGLERYHLRKASWSLEKTRAWLLALDPIARGRIVLHDHHALAPELNLAGVHYRDDDSSECLPSSAEDEMFTSRSCHDLVSLQRAIGRFNSVFLSPLFPSVSKAGYGPSEKWNWAEISRLLRQEPSGAALVASGIRDARTEVVALGGITVENVAACADLGFDGVAVIGSVWQAEDPLAAFGELQRACSRHRDGVGRSFPRHPLMCITQDGLALTHLQQTEQLCRAGARIIQLRMKNARREEWLETARAFVRICRSHGCVSVVNDSVDIALGSDADGVHLGKEDLEWREARALLGPRRFLGGTVNNHADAARAVSANCLDYVGLGPWRFTSNKAKLAPILGEGGVRDLVKAMGTMPCWIIGGIEAEDLPAVASTGAAGVAISSTLFRQNLVAANYARIREQWPATETLQNGSTASRSPETAPAPSALTL